MEHVFETEKIVCWDQALGEPRPKMRFLEMLYYPHRLEPTKDAGILDDSSLSDWLSKGFNLPVEGVPSDLPTDWQAPCSGQRLLFGFCSGDRKPGKRIGVLPFSEASWSIIRDRLALPEQFFQYMIRKGSPAFKVSTPQHSGRSLTCFVFKFSLHQPGYYQLALSYDRQTGLTHGLLLAMMEIGQEFPRLIKGLQDRFMYCEQPLLLAALVAELVIDSCAAKTDTADEDLNTLEEDSGLHGYGNRRKGDPLKMDFMKAIELLHFRSRTLGLDTLRLEFVCPALKHILNESKEITARTLSRSQEIGSNPNAIVMSDGLRMIEELVGYLYNSCENQILRAKYEENRIQTQLAVVSRLMAQKDAKVNINLAKDASLLARASRDDSVIMRAIAIESKRDSSSMKTIAVLGMLFLPSTLVASIFSVPMFSWDDNGLPIVNAGFKYYWVITIPLTLLVLVMWAIATLLPWGKWLSKLRGGSAVLDFGLELPDRADAQG